MDGESHQAQEARVEKLWRSLDTKREGRLNLQSLKEGFAKTNHPLQNADPLLREIMKTVDSNGDGHIEYSEFRAFVEHAERELWRLFQSIDHNHNGQLDKQELQAAFERAGIHVPSGKLDQFFCEVDTNHDGTISFEEWRSFLLFIPATNPNLRNIMSYYSSTVTFNSEGDVHVLSETQEGLGYFLAGGIAGVVSRTATAPLDRLKVYLIAQVGRKDEVLRAAKDGAPLKAAHTAARPLVNAVKELWKMGGVRSLFAGNGLNVIKVMPESAIRFGSYEGAKKAMARLEGHQDSDHLKPWSQFFAAGCGGIISQFAVYPLDTLKFRMQNETVTGGLRGNALIVATAKKMWRQGGVRTYYRGIAMGVAGMFPYSAIDLTTFENIKKLVVKRNMRRRHCSEDDAALGNFAIGSIGAFSGAVGASAVYPINLLRTRLQAQGTAIHPPTYTGIVDVAVKTVRGEGWKSLFKGITPNLLKVVPSVSITYVVYDNSKRLMGLR